MTGKDILTGSGALIAILSLIEISPLSLNPWGALLKLCKRALRSIGRTLNADTLKQLSDLQACQKEMRQRLDKHIEIDAERAMGGIRARILHFNNESLRGIYHTQEEYVDILSDIDSYEDYCDNHPDYPNNRAVMAIESIKEAYRKERM